MVFSLSLREIPSRHAIPVYRMVTVYLPAYPQRSLIGANIRQPYHAHYLVKYYDAGCDGDDSCVCACLYPSCVQADQRQPSFWFEAGAEGESGSELADCLRSRAAPAGAPNDFKHRCSCAQVGSLLPNVQYPCRELCAGDRAAQQ